MRIAGLLVGCVFGVLGALLFAHPAHAGWDISCFSRNQARDYGWEAINEGYKLGGGWWNNNDVKDSNEGPDCSGLTFKTWAMKSTSGSTAYFYWDKADNVHGPYAAVSFRDGCSGACSDVCGSGTGSACGSGSYSSTEPMDGFAKDGHVALIWNEQTDGYDEVLEAATPSLGVRVARVNYRARAEYDGIRRGAWCP